MSERDIDPNATQEVRENSENLYMWFVRESTRDQPLPADLQHVLDTGAFDINVSDRGANLLDVAARVGNTAVVKSLLEQGVQDRPSSSNSALLIAALAEKHETVQLLLDHGSEINPVTGSFGKTILHHRVSNGSKDDKFFSKILELGADPNVKDDRGATPLHYCQYLGLATDFYARTLLNAGADPNARRDDGWTPLCSSYNTQPERAVIQALLDHGANVHAQYHANIDDLQSSDLIISFIETAQPVFDAWQEGATQPQDLTKETVMQMLSVWPLDDPLADVPRFEQLDAIFKDARWKDEHAEHKLELIQEIPGLTPREQMFLMGGHARTLMQKQRDATPAQGAER